MTFRLLDKPMHLPGHRRNHLAVIENAKELGLLINTPVPVCNKNSFANRLGLCALFWCRQSMGRQ
jgi:hypothetical protein